MKLGTLELKKSEEIQYLLDDLGNVRVNIKEHFGNVDVLLKVEQGEFEVREFALDGGNANLGALVCIVTVGGVHIGVKEGCESLVYHRVNGLEWRALTTEVQYGHLLRVSGRGV